MNRLPPGVQATATVLQHAEGDACHASALTQAATGGAAEALDGAAGAGMEEAEAHEPIVLGGETTGVEAAGPVGAELGRIGNRFGLSGGGRAWGEQRERNGQKRLHGE